MFGFVLWSVVFLFAWRTGVLSFVVCYLLRRVSFCLWCVYFCDGAGAV